MILCIGTTPAAQRVMVFSHLRHGMVNRARLTLDGAAGKSINVAKVIAALGGEAFATGFLGGDRGEQIRNRLEKLGLGMQFVEVSARTRECITVIDENAGTQTELVEESPAVSPTEFQQLEAIIGDQIPKARAVILSGSICPGVPEDFYAACVRAAHLAKALAVVDARGRVLERALLCSPDVVKPNREELAATINRPVTDESSLLSGMRELQGKGGRFIVVTAGKEPTYAYDGQHVWRIQSPSIHALNPIGSGDSFTAAMTLHLLAGDDLGEACRWGAAVGAANAMTWMAGEVRSEDLTRLGREVLVQRIA